MLPSLLRKLTALAAFTFALSAHAQAPDLDHWRKAYADNLTQPDGWLTLVALQWLPEGTISAGSASDNKLQLKHVPVHLGIFQQHNGHVVLLPPTEGFASTVLVDGKPATSPAPFQLTTLTTPPTSLPATFTSSSSIAATATTSASRTLRSHPHPLPRPQVVRRQPQLPHYRQVGSLHARQNGPHSQRPRPIQRRAGPRLR